MDGTPGRHGGGEWRDGPALPVPRHGPGAVAINAEIYLIGGATGASGAGTSNRVSRYSKVSEKRVPLIQRR